MDFPVGPERFPCSPLLGSPAAVCIKVYRPLAQGSSDPLRKAPPVTPKLRNLTNHATSRLNFNSSQGPSPEVPLLAPFGRRAGGSNLESAHDAITLFDGIMWLSITFFNGIMWLSITFYDGTYLLDVLQYAPEGILCKETSIRKLSTGTLAPSASRSSSWGQGR